MSAFDIPPHPRRTARLALGVLAVIAMAGFAEGFLKQLAVSAPPPPPAAGPQASFVAEATPIAPTLQLAEAPRPHRAAATAADDDATPALQVPVAAAGPAAQAQPAPAADAAATAPEAAAPAPAPAPAKLDDPPT